MFMREPKIATGFIIFREGCEDQLTTGGVGHWRTARNWVESSKFRSEFYKVVNNPNYGDIHDYDDFLTDYVGAVRLYSLGGYLYCRIPRGNNNEYKSYLKNFFSSNDVIINGEKLTYRIYGDVSLETTITEKPVHIPNYNQLLVVDEEGNYHYNPNRIGD